jgi:uncharacterized cupin superfamily protein
MQDSDIRHKTAEAISPASDTSKLTAAQKNRVRLQRLRESLGSLVHQMAFTVPQAAVACGRTPTWGYRKVYSGEWRVTNQGGRLLVPRSEIEHFLSGATTYNPEGGEMNGQSQKR